MQQQARNITPATSSQRTSTEKAPVKVLAVDDDRLCLEFLERMLVQTGYEVLLARSGEDAMKALSASSHEIAAVLLDRHMPGIDGIEVVRQMKDNPAYSLIPVIMQTAADRPEEIRQGIDAGVYYYLTKPLDQKLLRSVVFAAITEFDIARVMRDELSNHRFALGKMDTAKFYFRTLEEVNQIAQLVSSCYPHPEKVVVGVLELMINAVEHGNLGVTYEEKTQLVTTGRWHDEIERRLQKPENVAKRAEMVFQRKADGLYLQITDHGEGFEWWRYLEMDPARATHPHGRGIALANKLSFDQLQFTQNGARVLAIVHHETPKLQPLKW